MGIELSDPPLVSRTATTTDAASSEQQPHHASPIAIRVLGLATVGVVALFAITRIASIRENVSETADTTISIAAYALATVLVALRVVRLRTHRWAWSAIGLGLACYTAAAIYASAVDGDTLPFPSAADLGWLLLVPFACIGVGLLIAAQVGQGQGRARELLTALVVTLGVAAVTVTVAIERLITDFPTFRARETVTKFAYPTTDALLLGAAIALLVVATNSTRVRLALLAIGLATFACADVAYLTLLTRGEYLPGDAVDVLYVAGLAAAGLAAWWWGAHAPRPASLHTPVVIPALAAAGAVGVLVVATQSSVTPISAVLAVATLAAFGVRLATGHRATSDAAG